MINRRAFMGLGVAAAASSLLPSEPQAALPGGGYLTTARDRVTGRFLLVGLDQSHEVLWETRLPGRGHEVLIRPGSQEGVVIARRPGVYALGFDVTTGETGALVPEPLGRHLYGHGVFSDDGDILFLTENLYDKARGVIGMYDARDGYRRLTEFPSRGIGPHQLALSPDGQTLVVANGGIHTHPSSGRKKLNVGTMEPNLTYLDAFGGTMLAQARFTDRRFQKLSMRHLVVLADGRTVIACQDEGAVEDQLPLVFLHDPTRGDHLDPLPVPAEVLAHMKGYCGSIAADNATGTIAVSAPRGGITCLWSVADGRFAGVVPLQDGCAIAPNRADKGFMLLSGDGQVAHAQGSDLEVLATHPFRQWDNHMTAITESG